MRERSRSYVQCRCVVTQKEREVLLDNLLSGKSRGPRGVNHVKNGGEAVGVLRNKTASLLGERFDAMKQRCENPNNTAYADYGGRGIKVCFIRDEFVKWGLDKFKYDDLITGQLNRIDNDGNYEFDNINLVPQRRNLRNKRDNRYIVFGGDKVIANDLWDLIKFLDRRFDLSKDRVARLVSQGATLERILDTKPRKKRSLLPPMEPNPAIVRMYQGTEGFKILSELVHKTGTQA